MDRLLQLRRYMQPLLRLWCAFVSEGLPSTRVAPHSLPQVTGRGETLPLWQECIIWYPWVYPSVFLQRPHSQLQRAMRQDAALRPFLRSNLSHRSLRVMLAAHPDSMPVWPYDIYDYMPSRQYAASSVFPRMQNDSALRSPRLL